MSSGFGELQPITGRRRQEMFFDKVSAIVTFTLKWMLS